MLPTAHKLAFLVFAGLTLAAAVPPWRRLYLRIAAGRRDTDGRFNNPGRRLWYSLVTTLTQRRTFRMRPFVSLFHSFIFYGFAFYLLVNFVDAFEGFIPFDIRSSSIPGALYNVVADVLSTLVLVGVIALVFRRFTSRSRKDFRFNARTLLHPAVLRGYVRFDSIIVSAFILFHVGSRAVGAGAKLVLEGGDPFQPFASFVSHLFSSANAEGWRIFGYWGALGSVLAFLAYFPRSKHIHIFMASVKYAAARDVSSGVLPSMELDAESDAPQLGANKLEDLAWPRLLDAYACIQCNRCQDACPATATGKSLSPSALEINKRMELNELSLLRCDTPSPNPLLQFALTPEAAWACTTCGACMQVCPVQDEPMLDIIDIRRQQVMMEGNFPAQLQSAFRGMERSNNPWGLSQEKRLDWAEGLNVKTTEENPEPDVLYWVGCAASYDPQAQKTARAFVQLLNHAGVDFAVLGKRECCTGDSARRAGNEFLYRQLAEKNVATLTAVKPKQIVATCPHCMNAVGKEYAQLGGDFKVIHHTEFLDGLVREGKLSATANESNVAFHDPCYLGRHNGVYDAPRNLLTIVSNSVTELERNREGSFCCGAGGAQFWKEEEPGDERISDNRFREAQRTLGNSPDSVLAVGCPFCKSMLESTPEKGSSGIQVKDVAELLLERLAVSERKVLQPVEISAETLSVGAPSILRAERASDHGYIREAEASSPVSSLLPADVEVAGSRADCGTQPVIPRTRKRWQPVRRLRAEISSPEPITPPEPLAPNSASATSQPSATGRKTWMPRRRFDPQSAQPAQSAHAVSRAYEPGTDPGGKVVEPAKELASSPQQTVTNRKLWKSRSMSPELSVASGSAMTSDPPQARLSHEAVTQQLPRGQRRPWTPKRKWTPS